MSIKEKEVGQDGKVVGQDKETVIDILEQKYLDSIVALTRRTFLLLTKRQEDLNCLVMNHKGLDDLCTAFLNFSYNVNNPQVFVYHRVITAMEDVYDELLKLVDDLKIMNDIPRLLAVASECFDSLHKPVDTKEDEEKRDLYKIKLAVDFDKFKFEAERSGTLLTKAAVTTKAAIESANKLEKELEKHETGLDRYYTLLTALKITGIANNTKNRQMIRHLASKIKMPKCICIKCRQRFRKVIEKGLRVPDVFVYVDPQFRPEFIELTRKFINAILAEF